MGKRYGQLGIEERTIIQTQLEMGIKPAAIALGLNRSASTLSRELSRNGSVRPKEGRGLARPPVAGCYRAQAAHQRAGACTLTPRVERQLTGASTTSSARGSICVRLGAGSIPLRASAAYNV